MDTIHKKHSSVEIGKERIRRAGEQVLTDLQEKNKKYTPQQGEEPDFTREDDKHKYIKNPNELDIGFKVFKIGETNINWNEVNSQNDIKTLEQLSNKDALDFKPHFKDENIVYEIGLTQRGIPLSSKLERLSDIGERTYLYANSYLVCLDTDISFEMLEKISLLKKNILSYYFRD